MEGISPKDFRYYHNPLDLLKNLTDVDINPKVLKNQTNFKSIRLKYIYILKKKKKSRSEIQIRVLQNVANLFDLREKIIAFFRDYSFLLSEAKYKVKYGKGLEMLSPKHMFILCTEQKKLLKMYITI